MDMYYIHKGLNERMNKQEPSSSSLLSPSFSRSMLSAELHTSPSRVLVFHISICEEVCSLALNNSRMWKKECVSSRAFNKKSE